MLLNESLTNKFRHGVGKALNALDAGIGLPMIRGKWFVVDPYATARDYISGDVYPDIASAYAVCVSGRGDGILVMSGGTTASHTTSYLKQPIVWSKHAITVYGVDSGNGIFNRARVANVDVVSTVATSETASTIVRAAGSFITDGWVVGMTGYIAQTGGNNGATFTVTGVAALTLTVSETLQVVSSASAVLTSYCASLITLSGNNNKFINVNFWNGGTQVGALGGINITGARNKFLNCHIVGGAGCSATANERSLELGTGAQENIFVGCTIGTDTVDRGNNANCELYINGTKAGTARNYFYGCTFLSEAEGGTAHLAVKFAGTTCMGRHMIFRDCDFVCYTENKGTWQASAFGGTVPDSAEVLISGTSATLGYTVWDNTSATTVFISSPSGNATGGVGQVG